MTIIICNTTRTQEQNHSWKRQRQYLITDVVDANLRVALKCTRNQRREHFANRNSETGERKWRHLVTWCWDGASRHLSIVKYLFPAALWNLLVASVQFLLLLLMMLLIGDRSQILLSLTSMSFLLQLIMR